MTTTATGPVRPTEPPTLRFPPLFLLFCVLVACLPLPLGGNRPMMWMLTMAATFLLSAVWLVQFCRLKAAVTPAIRLAWPVILVLGLVGCWILVQTVLPGELRTRELKASQFAFLKTMMYLSVFSLCLLLVQTRAQLETLTWVIVLGGVFQVLVRVVWGVEGTFVNPNHFAGYLEMALALGMGLMIGKLEQRGARSWRERIRRTVGTLLGPKVILRILIVVLVIGLILSRSRMGNTAFFASLFVAGIIGLIAFRRVNRSVVIFFISILVIDIFLMGAFFGIDQLQQRFEQLNIAEDSRRIQSEQTIQMLEDNWWTGIGAGAYYTIYPAYRDHRIDRYLDQAHNDLLQFPVELGLPVALLLFTCVAGVLLLSVRVQLVRRSQFMKAMGFGAFMGLVSILVHSTADFNLQLTANAGTFMVLLAIPFLAWSIDRRGQPREGVP